jgi:hypothetical protein
MSRAQSDAAIAMAELKRIAVSITAQLATLNGAITVAQAVAADAENSDLADLKDIAEWQQFSDDVSAAIGLPEVAAALATLSGG